jgi:hypothetical protein
MGEKALGKWEMIREEKLVGEMVYKVSILAMSEVADPEILGGQQTVSSSLQLGRILFYSCFCPVLNLACAYVDTGTCV